MGKYLCMFILLLGFTQLVLIFDSFLKQDAKYKEIL
jgi:hypothetical protein